eukprot:scaffold8732_cov133-Isochrysis_galbana.AAC.3
MKGAIGRSSFAARIARCFGLNHTQSPIVNQSYSRTAVITASAHPFLCESRRAAQPPGLKRCLRTWVVVVAVAGA